MLVIVDVQKGFVNEHTRDSVADIEALQRRFETVIATRFLNPRGSWYEKRTGSQS